jgi:phosphatidylglycerol:prolipoprotein diacylglycerol transferase
VHPIAFQIGSLTVHFYGVMVALGFVLGLGLAARRGLRDGLRPEWIADLGVPLILGTLVGARAFYVLTFWREQFAGRPLWEAFAVWQGGLVFYGGLVGATAAGLGYMRWKGWPLWKLTDALAPSVALGFALGRVGCLLNGCCYGQACSLPWAIHFPADNPMHAPTTPVHPTQIYDFLWALGLYVALVWLYRRKHFDGQIFTLFLVGYAVLRSVVELFRGDYGDVHRFGPLTPAQTFSIAVVAAAALLYWRLSQRTPERAVGKKGR